MASGNFSVFNYFARVFVLTCTGLVWTCNAYQTWTNWSAEVGGNGHWYLLTEPISRPAAEERAVSLGGHLASISGQAEDTFVRNLAFPRVRSWIGLTMTDQGFVWSDGSSLIYRNFVYWDFQLSPSPGMAITINSPSQTSGHWGWSFTNGFHPAVIELQTSPYAGPAGVVRNLIAVEITQDGERLVSQERPILEGNPVKLPGASAGQLPLTYQWKKGGRILAGETNTTLLVTAEASAEAYTLVVSNDLGTSESDEYVLHAIPVIRSEGLTWFQWPAEYGGNDHWYGFYRRAASKGMIEGVLRSWNSHLASIGSIAELDFISKMEQFPPHSYPYKIGLSGGPGEKFTWSDGTGRFPQLGLPLTNEASHAVVWAIRDGGRFYQTQQPEWAWMMTLFEIPGHPSELPPAIRTAPVGGEFSSTIPVNFKAEALGADPMHYQWKVGGMLVVGETNKNYEMALTTLQTGKVSVVVSNANGILESPAVEIKIVPAVDINRYFGSNGPQRRMATAIGTDFSPRNPPTGLLPA